VNRHAKATSAFTPGRSAALALAFGALALLAFAHAASAGKVLDRVVAGDTAPGMTQGLLNNPRGVAVNYDTVADAGTDPLGASTDGYVYVVDEDNHRVQVFSPDGTFRFMWGRGVDTGGDGHEVCDSSEVPCTATTADDEQGELDDPQGIAINQSTGHVYLRDRDNRRVQQFAANGNFIRAWGHDVAASTSPDNTGTGFEVCTTDCKIGTSGTLGGQLASSSAASTGIAVVPAGAANAGNVIVADPGNRRVQEFTASGSWVRAWGWDVIVPGGTGEQIAGVVNERQSVALLGDFCCFAPVAGGNFTLSFEGSGPSTPIPFNASTATVQAALEGLSTIGAGDVSVSGSGSIRTVEFTGALAGTDVPLMAGASIDLVDTFGLPGSVSISLSSAGGPVPGFESCTVSAECKAGASSSPADQSGAFASGSPTHLAADSAGIVYASDSAGSNRVQRFDSAKAAAPDLVRSSIDVTGVTGTASTATTGLDVTPSGNLLVGRSDTVGVLEIATPGGTPLDLDRHYQGSGLTPSAIEMDGTGADLYLSSSSGGHRLFAAADPPPPTASLKTVDRFIGGPQGQLGGQFAGPLDMAVNANGTGAADPGDTYVADSGNNRIQVFDASGNFKFAIGKDVIAAGAPGDQGKGFEKCTVAADCKRGEEGSLAGELDNPQGIAINQATGDVIVRETDNPRVSQFSAGGNFIRSWAYGGARWAVVIRAKPGAGDTIAGGTFTLSFGGETTAPIPYSDSPSLAATVDSALEAIPTIGAGNVTVSPDGITFPSARSFFIDFTGALSGLSQKTSNFSGDGSALKVEGKGQVVQGGADVHTAPVSAPPANGIAVAPAGAPNAGHVFVADPKNQRVQEFDPSQPDASVLVRAIGSAAQFGNEQPQHIAVDSDGILYASNSSGGARIERFNAAAAAMTPISSPPLLAGSTQGLEASPDTDGIGPDVDRLYVLRNPSSGNTVVQQFDAPGAASPPATIAETHMPSEFGESSANGLGLDTLADRLLVSSSQGSAGHGYFILDADGTGAGIAAEIDSPSNLGTTSMTFNGTVDPAAGLVKYHFEYSEDGVNWFSLPSQAISGAGPQPVSQAATGLSPNTDHRIRLVVTKVLGPNTILTDTSDQELAKTLKAVPTVATRGVLSYSDDSAWIVGSVNPNGSSTTYRFEFGKTTAYTDAAPQPDGNAGSGAKARNFRHKLVNLEPNTTYHYRIIAENDLGVVQGFDRSFTTRPEFAGFPARAYEQVTPTEKVGNLAPYADAVAADGNGAAFRAFEPAAGANVGSPTPPGIPYPYVSRRLEDRWVSLPAAPRTRGGAGGYSLGALGGPSFSTGIVNGFGEHGTTSPVGVFRRDYTTATQELLYQVNHETGLNEGGPGELANPVETTADLGHIVWVSVFMNIDDPSIPAASVTKVWEWVEPGTIRLVSVDESGVPFQTETKVGGGRTRTTADAQSDDGRHIFFSAGFDGNDEANLKIYRRSDGTTTTLVSPSQRTPADPQGEKGKQYRGASSDGDRVLFTSSEQLTNDANTGPERTGVDLYRYEVSSDSLIDISAESNTVNGARVLGVVGYSDAADRVYYVAEGEVIAGAGTVGQPNLYAWHEDGSAEGETRFIATLPPGEEGIDSTYGRDELTKTARVSEDGTVMAFDSAGDLAGQPDDGHSHVYVYEAEAGNGAGTLSCVSCRPNGTAAQGSSSLISGNILNLSADGDHASRNLSEDGSRIFFNSTDNILPEDTNGTITDVYMWEAGRLALMSPSGSPFDSTFAGASESGDDVFVRTRERLVTQDFGISYDIYDYRVGGGLASQFPTPPDEPCQGTEGCKPPPSAPITAPNPASSGFAGQGNVSEPPSAKRPKRCGKGKVKRKGRCIKRKQVKRGAKNRAAKAKRRGNK
jgi:sugar lactone lactonase YvrE